MLKRLSGARMTTLAFCQHTSSSVDRSHAFAWFGNPFLSPTSHRQACTLRLSSFSSVRYRFRDRHVMFHAYLFVIMIAFCDPIPLVLVLDVSRPLHDARLDELRSSSYFSSNPIHLNYDLFTLIRVTPCLIRTGIWMLMFTMSLLVQLLSINQPFVLTWFLILFFCSYLSLLDISTEGTRSPQMYQRSD